MKQTILYTYLGTNGSITTPIHLEGIYSRKEYHLTADENKQLTKDGKKFVNSTIVFEDDLGLWSEVDKI